MNKKIILIVLLLGIVPSLTVAGSKTAENMLKEEKSKENSSDDYFESMKLFPAAIEQGSKTVSGLEANLKHIKRLEIDPDYRECVYIGERIKKVVSLINKFSDAFEKREIAESGYQSAMDKYKNEKETLQQELNEKKCNEREK